MRMITIRIDDVTDDMDWKKFEEFEALLNRYAIKPLIGVIPRNLDKALKIGEKPGNYAKWLSEHEKNGWVIAMHGYDHCYVTKKGGIFPLNHFSEFAGLSLEEQKEKISKGKEALEELGIHTNIFMAPGHSYDRKTLTALKECGFSYVTDGFGSMPYLRKGITFLPIAIKKRSEFKAAKGFSTFVVHTATMRTEDFSEYERFFQEYREHFIDYGKFLEQKAKKRNFVGNCVEYWLAVLKHWMMN